MTFLPVTPRPQITSAMVALAWSVLHDSSERALAGHVLAQMVLEAVEAAS